MTLGPPPMRFSSAKVPRSRVIHEDSWRTKVAKEARRRPPTRLAKPQSRSPTCQRVEAMAAAATTAVQSLSPLSARVIDGSIREASIFWNEAGVTVPMSAQTMYSNEPDTEPGGLPAGGHSLQDDWHHDRALLDLEVCGRLWAGR